MQTFYLILFFRGGFICLCSFFVSKEDLVYMIEVMKITQKKSKKNNNVKNNDKMKFKKNCFTFPFYVPRSYLFITGQYSLIFKKIRLSYH